MGSTAWQEARRVAGYLSKYVTKTFDCNVRGLHRYEVAQGFQPAVTRLQGRTAAEVLSRASERMGGRPDIAWSLAEVLDCQGPPAVWFAWAA